MLSAVRSCVSNQFKLIAADSHFISLLCRATPALIAPLECRHQINKQRKQKNAVQDEGCVRSTYRRLCVPGLILYLSRRTLGRGLLSLCRGYTSESWSSPFYVSSGSRPSSPHIHLEDQQTRISLMNKEFKVVAWQISVNAALDRCHIWFYLIIFLHSSIF